MIRQWCLLLGILLLWIPIAAAQDEDGEFIEYNVSRWQNIIPIAVRYNVCLETIIANNLGIVVDNNSPFTRGLPLIYSSIDTVLNIPTDAEPCFESFILESGTRILDFLRDNNVCINDYLAYNDDFPLHYELPETRTIHLRQDVPPCYEAGQRRIFYRDGELLPEPTTVAAQRYTADENGYLWDIAWANDWCWIDVEAVNHPFAYMNGLLEGDVYYVPDDVRACEVLHPEGASLADLSFEYNVCVETLMEFNPYMVTTWAYIKQDSADEPVGMRAMVREVSIPFDHATCYDENGLRIGHNDKAIHRTDRDEWLHQIAQQYDVCVSDLLDANPFIGADWNNPQHLPALLYIPDTESCAERMGDTLIHTIREGEGYSEILIHYNICVNRLASANPVLLEPRGNSTYGLREINTGQHYSFHWMEIGAELVILQDRLPCYDMFDENNPWGENFYARMQFIPYVCYVQEIDFEADYSNHEPVISPVPYGSDEATYCYDFDKLGRIILNNETVWYYSAFIAEPAMMIDCFGVHPESVNVGLWQIETDYIPTGWYWTVSNPPHSCSLVTGTPDESKAWRDEFRARIFEEAGMVNDDGIYTVTSGDTLSSIGRKYGYLPSMLAAANDMQHPDVLLMYQPLQLPQYPSLYALAKVGGGVLLIVTFIGAIQFGMRRRGGGKKKKRSE
jgi:hypothetical protein